MLPAGICTRAWAGGAARLALGECCHQFAHCRSPGCLPGLRSHIKITHPSGRVGGCSRASSILSAALQHRPWGETQGSRKLEDARKLEHVKKYEEEVCVSHFGAFSGQWKRRHSRHKGVVGLAWLPHVPSKLLLHPHRHAPRGAGINVYVYECFRKYCGDF